MNLTRKEVTDIASTIDLSCAELRGFVEVESGGSGFGNDGKIVIQFEPHIFSRYLTDKKIAHTLTKKVLNKKTYYAISVAKKPLLVSRGKSDAGIASGSWNILNGVEGQVQEYKAFSIAMSIDPDSALLSTSIGLMQIMGFNFYKLGYKTVNAMWDDFKKGEYQQVLGGAKFIKSVPKLWNALKSFKTATDDAVKIELARIAAYYYNGSNYEVNNYHIKIFRAITKYSA